MAELKHYGVLGMRWGQHKAQVSGPKAHFARSLKQKYGVTPQEAKAKIKSGVSTLAKRVLPTKENSYGYILSKQEVDGAKAFVNKVMESKAFKALVFDKNNTTAGILKKSEVEKAKASVAKLGKKLDTMRDNFNKRQYQSALSTLAKVKARGDKVQEKELQDEIDMLFTPEEIKRWSS